MVDVVALGELLIDFAPVSADAAGYPTVAAKPGGAPANFLAALSRFGAKTALIGKVGEDSFGKLLRQTLETEGVDTRGLVSDPSVFTTLAFVTLDGRGERSFSFARKPGADTCLSADEIDFSLIGETRVFHFGTLSLTHEPARSATRKAVAYARGLGKTLSFDPNLRRPLWESEAEAGEQILWGLSQADLVKISDEEVDFLWGCAPEAGAEKLVSEYGVSLAFVTCGAEGCYFRTRTVSGHADALSGIAVVDTTGAGDIFGGSALWKLLQTKKPPEELTGEELTDIARFGCVAAGLSTTRYGGISSVPSLYEVLEVARL